MTGKFKGYCDTNVLCFMNGNFIQIAGVTYSATGNTQDDVFKNLVKQIIASQTIDKIIYPINVQISPLV